MGGNTTHRNRWYFFRFWAENGFVDLVLCEALENCAAKHEEKVNDYVSETRAVVEVMYESAWKDFRRFSRVTMCSFGSRNVNFMSLVDTEVVRRSIGDVKKQRTKQSLCKWRLSRMEERVQKVMAEPKW